MMDYKKVLKNRELRLRILRLLSFVPDKLMLKLQYRIKTGRKLNLKNPTRFTEKLQWYKLYYKNPAMIQCVDKYDVREYVKSKGLENILIPCYGVFNSPDEIDWDTLPNQFVMKDTLGGGGTSVIIVKDKSKDNINNLKKSAAEWVAIDAHRRDGGREWPYYSGKKHRIIIEDYIDSNLADGGLIDYKFLCFNGKTVLIYVLADRIMGKGAGCGFFDLDFTPIPVTESDEEPLKRAIPTPKNLQRMIQIAEKLAEEFPCARIDLYDEKGIIRFGEITFYDSSGYMIFNPDEYDYELGEKFVLPEIRIQ